MFENIKAFEMKLKISEMMCKTTALSIFPALRTYY
jgi:hypothetical protein